MVPMRSLFAIPISSDRLWETSFFLITLYLLFFPPLSHPQSTAVALGGGLFLLLFRTIPREALEGMGRGSVLFLLFLPLSAFWSIQPGITLQSAGFLFLGVLLYWMARSNGNAAQSRMEIGGLFLAGLAALSALRQWLFGFAEDQALLPHLSRPEFQEVEKAVFYHRATGPLVTPGALAALMVLFIPLGFTLASVGTGFKKWFFGFLTLLMGLALLATQSVGAFAALAAACLVIFAARRAWAGVAVVSALGLTAMAGVVWARGLQHWDISSFSGRLGLWGHAFQLFSAHPLLGSGLGTFGEAYQRAGFPLDSGASRFAHNIFIQLLVETGLVGIAFFFWTMFSLIRRFKVPARWEGWGAMTGVLAFFLFSLVDLPFQMPELTLFFALVLGRLECRPEKPIRLPAVSIKAKEYGLLGVLLVSGFWPPFHAWNFALLAVSLWSLAALFGQKFEKVPIWIVLGALFLGLRAFFSPSALGAVWFLEITGVLLAFTLVLPCFDKPGRFLRFFFLLGLVWAIKVWWASFHYSEPGLSAWVHFQFSDVKDWVMFPNPKQVGIFLIPLVLAVWRKPLGFSRWLASGAAFLTMIRLKASSSLAGLGAGLFYRIWAKSRPWAMVFALVSGASLFAYRFHDSSATSKDRLNIWRDCGQVWLQSPWIGVGPGAFAGLYHQVKTPRAAGVNRYLMDAEYAHNEFLDFLTAFGLAGLGFGILLFARAWVRVKGPDDRAALVGLGAASFVDFCLHTPLIALQGVGLLAGEQHRKAEITVAGGVLAFGLGLGLFGPPVFSEILKNRAQADLVQNQFLPADLRGLEVAEKLNAWDARIAAAGASYMDRLYTETKDPNWARKSDEAFERVLNLEPTDGQWKFERAERLTGRLALGATPLAIQAAQDAWRDAEQAMPFNALIRFEEGQFLIHRGDKDGALLDFQKAAQLEPNYAAAWVNLGLLLQEKGYKAGSHSAFLTALGVYDQWKDAQRISDTEREMVSLPPATVSFLEKEAVR